MKKIIILIFIFSSIGAWADQRMKRTVDRIERITARKLQSEGVRLSYRLLSCDNEYYDDVNEKNIPWWDAWSRCKECKNEAVQKWLGIGNYVRTNTWKSYWADLKRRWDEPTDYSKPVIGQVPAWFDIAGIGGGCKITGEMATKLYVSMMKGQVTSGMLFKELGMHGANDIVKQAGKLSRSKRIFEKASDEYFKIAKRNTDKLREFGYISDADMMILKRAEDKCDGCLATYEREWALFQKICSDISSEFFNCLGDSATNAPRIR